MSGISGITSARNQARQERQAAARRGQGTQIASLRGAREVEMQITDISDVPLQSEPTELQNPLDGAFYTLAGYDF